MIVYDIFLDDHSNEAPTIEAVTCHIKAGDAACNVGFTDHIIVLYSSGRNNSTIILKHDMVTVMKTAEALMQCFIKLRIALDWILLCELAS